MKSRKPNVSKPIDSRGYPTKSGITAPKTTGTAVAAAKVAKSAARGAK